MRRSESETTELVSVAELFPAVGSVTPAGALIVAVLLSVPVALFAIVAVNVKVAVVLPARLTLALMLPEPLAEPQLAPGEAVHVHVALVKVAGSVSTTLASVIMLGPLFVAVIV